MANARKQNEASQSAIDWQTFFHDDNVPILGYDAVNDQIIIKRGANYGTFVRGVTTATTSHDIYIYDMRTGSWTKSMNGLDNNVDTTNFVVNGSSELVCKASHGSTTTIYKWQPGPIATSTFKWKSKAFDFNYPALKKKLYKIIVHATAGTNTVITAGYDNATASNIFASNTFNTSTDLKRNEFIVSSPTVFSYLDIQIESSGGNTPAAFEINDIALVYRLLRPH